MLLKLKRILLLLLFIFSGTFCAKKKTYPQSPLIEFRSFTPYTDGSGDLMISFTDGDGDIGKKREDQSYNLFTTYYYFDSSIMKFRAIYDDINLDTLRTPYTIRKPSDDYNHTSIKGELTVSMTKYRASVMHKRIKYVMYLIDNAGNRSNILVTPELAVP